MSGTYRRWALRHSANDNHLLPFKLYLAYYRMLRKLADLEVFTPTWFTPLGD